MRNSINKYGVYIAAFLTVVFWASAFPAVKFCLRYYSSESIMLLRFLIASAVLGVYCLAAKTKIPEKRDLPRFALTGFIGIFLYMWSFNSGTNLVTSGLSSFIIAACPVATLLLSIVFLKERPGLLCWVGILISFAGLLLIASTQVHGLSINFGVVLLLGAMLCTSVYNILQRDLLKKYSPIQATAFAVFFATAFMLLFTPRLLRELPSSPLAANAVIIYLGVFPAALSYFLWGWALSRAEKTIQVTGFLYLSPFIAAALSYVWLGERLEPLVLVGGCIIIAGLVVANLRKASKE